MKQGGTFTGSFMEAGLFFTANSYPSLILDRITSHGRRQVSVNPIHTRRQFVKRCICRGPCQRGMKNGYSSGCAGAR